MYSDETENVNILLKISLEIIRNAISAISTYNDYTRFRCISLNHFICYIYWFSLTILSLFESDFLCVCVGGGIIYMLKKNLNSYPNHKS